jgi:hypothetical protein
MNVMALIAKEWLPHFQFDFTEKIIGAVTALIAIAETIRRLVRWFVERRAPSDLREFSFAQIIDYKHRRSLKPEFFRFIGPMAADFEQGYVYLRPEVDQLLERLRSEPLIGVQGDPAAGKTVVLSFFGYKILRSRRFSPLKRQAVYLIRLKESTIKESQLAKLRHLHKSAVVIVDDCHLDRKFTEQLIAPPAPGCHVVLVSRPPDLDKERIDPLQKSLFRAAFEKALKITASDAASQIVSLYSDRNNLEIETGNSRAIVGKYGHNLMILSWALDTLRQQNSFKEADVSRAAARWLLPEFGTPEGFYRDLREKDRGKIRPNEAAAIFLILASSYRYEVPVSRGFLEHDLHVKDAHLDLVIKSRMATADQDQIGLTHSALANLFIKAAADPLLGEVVRTVERKSSGSFPNGVLRSYIKARPEYACQLFASSDMHSSQTSQAIAKGNETVIGQGIMLEKSFSKIVYAISNIREMDEATARDILESNSEIIEALGSKIRDAELGHSLGWEVAVICAFGEAVKAAPVVDPDVLKRHWGMDFLVRDDFGVELDALGKRIALKVIAIVAEKILNASGSGVDYWTQFTAQLEAFFSGMRYHGLLLEGKPLVYQLAPSIARKLDDETTPRKITALCVLTLTEGDQALGKAIVDALSPRGQAVLRELRANPPNELIRSIVEKLFS